MAIRWKLAHQGAPIGGVNAIHINIAPEDPESEIAQGLLREYFAELAARFPDGFQLDLTVAAPSEDLLSPRGAFLVVFVDDVPVGCGAVRVLEESVAELKRMWINPTHRSRGLGRRLLIALETVAYDLGCSRIRLDTNGHLGEALSLYVAMGYREIASYNENLYATHWFEKAKS